MLQIAVILINYNTSKLTIACVNSILEKTSQNLSYKIYIVDNNSEINDYINLKNYVDNHWSNKINLIRSKINRGFGGGNMLGVQYAENSEYLAFINNDTLFLNDCLSILYNNIINNSKIGMVGGQSYDENDKEIISFDHYASTVRQIFGRSFLEFINSKKYPKRKKSYNTTIEVNTVSGSFMLINRNDFNNIGGFDENLFLYYEETDLCLRLKKINKTCHFIPTAKYLHYHGSSTNHNILIKKELKISLIYLVQKHYGWFSKTILLIYLTITALISALVKPKKWTFVLLYLQGAPLSKSLKNKQQIIEI